MAGILEFDASSLRALLRQANEATAFRLSAEELYDPSMHVNGILPLPSNGLPDAKTIDTAKLMPRLWLVKGEGIFLTPNAAPTGSQQPLRTYARGLSPDDPQSDLHGRQIMGCRDCLISLPATAFVGILKEDFDTVRIRVSAKHIQFLA
jgi:hypothetical protein